MALRQQDQSRATQIGSSYISSLKQPFSAENLTFIQKTTRTSGDKGFAMFLKDSNQVNSVLGSNAAQNFVKRIIGIEEVEPYLKNINGKPDWSSIEQRAVSKYGTLGKEYVDGRQMVYYWSAQPINGDSLGKYYKLYFEKALPRSEYHINNASWAVFESVNDPAVLALAVKVSKYNVDHIAPNDPTDIDTYANLLYKTGKAKEAIEWEEKAVQLSNHNPSLVATLEKMKKGEPTWPVAVNR
jgi:hypothetical protein